MPSCPLPALSCLSVSHSLPLSFSPPSSLMTFLCLSPFSSPSPNLLSLSVPPPIPAPVLPCLSLAPSSSHLVPFPVPPPAGPCPSHATLPVPEPDHHLAALAEPPLRSNGGGRGSGAPATERSGGAEAPLPRRRRDAWWGTGSALGRRGFPVPGPAGGCPGPRLRPFRDSVACTPWAPTRATLCRVVWVLARPSPRTNQALGGTQTGVYVNWAVRKAGHTPPRSAAGRFP